MPDKEVMPLLTDKEEDYCAPTLEQLEAYLATPDDEVAAEVRKNYPKEFVKIGRAILWGKNIAKKQRDACQLWHEEQCEACKVLLDSFVERINYLEAKEREQGLKEVILCNALKEITELAPRKKLNLPYAIQVVEIADKALAELRKEGK